MTDSINERTIVILVISLVIVIILSTFLTKLSHSNELSAPVEESDAPAATLDEPLTLSNNEVIIKQGNAQLINVGVFNPTTETVNDISPVIICDDSTITSDSIATSIPGGENIQVSLLIKTTKKTTQEIHICRIALNGALSTIKNADILVRII